MRCYINPENETKEDFLQREGDHALNVNDVYISEDKLPVCLIFNGEFTSAAVAYSLNELKSFSDIDDPRPKIWYMVNKEKLFSVSNLKEFI